jgi:DNA adenine methylase
MLTSPFPYFGGKRRAASLIWERLGNVPNYIEPFCGSAAVMLARPHEPHTETINDADGLLCNFWRALKLRPDDLARHADWPVNALDITARHNALLRHRGDVTARLAADPDWCDPRLAAWWVYVMCGSIGSPLTGGPMAIRTPHIGNLGRGIHALTFEGLEAIATRLRRVRVCCGDWSAPLSPASTFSAWATCGVVLDPPYDDGASVYANNARISSQVRAWAAEHGANERFRIALCGYEGEHDELEALGWDVVAWKAKGGYGSQAQGAARANSSRERIWFSPGCLRSSQLAML